MKKKKKLIILGIVLFLITFGVCAETILYSANNVTYNNSSLAGNNVKDALDNLVNKCESSNTTCPSGMTCTDKTNIKCKRATTLHTETCSNTDASHYCQGAGYASGATITYGNQTITEGVLTTGDAFDCDVNGDGTFDSATERFYYVGNYFDTSTKNFNDNVAVLIYYSNVRDGVANTQGSAYATTSDSQNFGSCSGNFGCNWYGPVTAREQLPTTTQWSNVGLYKETRAILPQAITTETTGGTLPTAFSYSGYSARLLTYQEVYNACYDYSKIRYNQSVALDIKCQFLMEGTKYSSDNLTSSIMLESPDFSSFYFVTDVSSGSNCTYGGLCLYNTYTVADCTYSGARPTIEVLKSEILY